MAVAVAVGVALGVADGVPLGVGVGIGVSVQHANLNDPTRVFHALLEVAE